MLQWRVLEGAGIVLKAVMNLLKIIWTAVPSKMRSCKYASSIKYNGRTFKVYVSLTDPETRYDDYLRQDIDEYLSDYFAAELDCDDIHVWATYGVPVCMIPGDVKTVEDVFAKCDNIQIYISTFGLDRDRAKNLDVTGLGSNTEISIIDWTSEECLMDEELM